MKRIAFSRFWASGTASRPRRRRWLNLERLEDRTVPQGAPITGPTTLHAGDRVRIDVTITTANDSNEDGEGETLDVQSNGTNILSDGAYNTTSSYTYLAVNVDEALTANFSGEDGDESGSVTVTVTTGQTPRFSDQEKKQFTDLMDAWNLQSNRDWRASIGFGFGGALSGTAAVISALPTFGTGAAFFTGLGVGLAGDSAFFAARATYDSDKAIAYGKLARDPFDPNFTTVQQPVLKPLYYLSQDPTVMPFVPTFQAVLTNEATELALLEALDTAANRANSAQQMGDTASEALQVQAISTFEHNLANTLSVQPALLANAQSAVMTLAGTTSVAGTSADVQTFEQGLQQNGLPAISQQVLGLTGNTAADIQAITNVLFVQDINAAAGDPVLQLTDPTLLGQVQSLTGLLRGSSVPKIFATGADAGGGPHVKVFDAAGNVLFSFYAYDPGFTGGVRVAVGDVNGDGTPDIVTAPGAGGGPDIRVFDGKTGTMIDEFFAYASNFTAGVYVAVGDVNGDGKADIITGAGAGGGPHIKAFSGADNSVLQSFFAYDATFTGGVTVAAGDVNGDGKADIVTGAGPGGGPHVKVFSGTDLTVLQSFFAYDQGFTGGIFVAAGDVNGDGKADIITGAGPGGGPHVKVFDGASNALINQFFAFEDTFTGGVGVGVVDANGDGKADLLFGPGAGGGPRARVVGADGATVFADLFAFDPGFLGGITVG
jgi:hypothetical protein